MARLELRLRGAMEQERPVQTICLVTLTLLAVAAALYWLRPVVIPFVLALFFATCLSPLLELQTRRLRLPRGIAVVSTLLLACAVMVAVGLLLEGAVRGIVAQSETYQERFDQLLSDIEESLPDSFLGLAPDETLATVTQASRGALGSLALGTANALLAVLQNGVLVLIFVMFLLLDPRGSSAGSSSWSFVSKSIRSYLLTKTVISAITGILVGATLRILGVEPALVFGFFAFLLNFIPSIGSIVASLLPLPIVLADPQISVTTGILALAIPGAIQFVVGNVIEPKVMGSSLQLHPVVILLALIFWGMIWGIVGMFLAVPLTVAAKAVLDRAGVTAFASELVRGRPDGPVRDRLEEPEAG